ASTQMAFTNMNDLLAQLNSGLMDGPSLFTGLNGMLPKLLFALVGSLVLLRFCDRRLSAIGPAALVAVASLVTAIPVIIRSTGILAYSLLGVGAAVMALVALLLIGRWSQLSPAQLQAEVEDSDATSKQAKRARRRGIRNQQTRPPSRWESVLLAVGLLVFGVAALLPMSAGGVDAPGELSRVGLDLQRQWLPRLYGFTVVGIWSTTIFYMIQLTWLSSPDSFDKDREALVRWRVAMMTATLFFSLALLTCLAVFLRSSEMEPGAEMAEQVIPVVFALTWLVVSFIAWMIPARVSRFQREGRAEGWTSLTLAGWLACCCLAVLSALPEDWPWRLF
ncbi:MAG: hypothetical protein AAGG44_20900, partial [Planctomycetota bacterium]